MTLTALAQWLNDTYPRRDWNQWCQALVWNVVWHVLGVPENALYPPYPSATAARLASRIESTDPLRAPAGAIHYWKHPADGHVGVSLGAGLVLMTGTPEALGAGATMLGTNYGTTTVAAYTAARRNTYIGWSLTNGRYPSLVGRLNSHTPTITQEIDMKLIKVVQPTGTTWALVGLGFFQETRDPAQANAWAEVWGDSRQVSDLAWEQAYNAALLGQGMLSRVTK
ncbi:MAG: hypothetical protein LCH36_00365 [Actinobacteria bacterium]|nr:hypothetical protein [Actinomycetota bacterium]